MTLVGAKKVAIEAAKSAGKILMKNWNNTKSKSKKDDGQLQLNLDIESEVAIIQTIQKKFPEHNIISEEGLEQKRGSEYTWIIDPLDGTHNYFFKIPTFAISIALMCKEEVVFALIYLPFFPRLFIAEKGKGAYSGFNVKRKLKVSDRKNLKEGVMLYDSSFYRNKEDVFDTFSKLSDKTFCVRVLGSTTLNFSLVVDQKADFLVMHKTKPWDIAAGCLLVEEAGGKVTDLNGKPWTIHSKDLIASNGKVHNKVLRIIKSSRKKKENLK